jgi:uroporphyrinogen-III synthase
VIDSGPLDAAIRRLREGLARAEIKDQAFDWIIFANANTASFFINRLFALGHDVRVLSGVKLAIADRDAAEILLEYGLVADFIPIRNAIEDIASELGNTTGQRVLVSCSAMGPSNSSATKDLVDTLRAWGTQVETVSTHTIQPTNPDPEAISVLFDGSVKVATFTDPLGLTSLAKILHDRSVADVLSPLTVACIDPATSDAAAALGVRVDLVADGHTIEGMTKTLVKWRTVEQSI